MQSTINQSRSNIYLSDEKSSYFHIKKNKCENLDIIMIIQRTFGNSKNNLAPKNKTKKKVHNRIVWLRMRGNNLLEEF